MNKEIKLLEDGTIRLKTGRVVSPVNKVVSIKNGVVKFLLNKNQYEGTIDLADYCKFSLWNARLTFDHADIKKGIIAFDTGFEHKSLAAAIMNTDKLHKVTYNNNDRFDCRKENLKVAVNDHLIG